MATLTHYDIIIIGTGPGGGTLAYKLALSREKSVACEPAEDCRREGARGKLMRSVISQ
jgi:2-polyprenyl-6-methoxyphenol hydroxylase-like FAD-dependent oxidoreductase